MFSLLHPFAGPNTEPKPYNVLLKHGFLSSPRAKLGESLFAFQSPPLRAPPGRVGLGLGTPSPLFWGRDFKKSRFWVHLRQWQVAMTLPSC